MNIKNFELYKGFDEKGLKKQATASLREFISSFYSETEIKNWVFSYLPESVKNHHSRIRHEIFAELVYPALKRGYLNQEFNSTLWLGKLIQNIYQNKTLHEELHYVSEFQLFLKAYEIDPSSTEAKDLLLGTIVRQLEYAIHEWPSGLLWGNNGANLEQCGELSKELNLAKKLNSRQEYSLFLDDFEVKLLEYRKKLN